MNTGLHEDAGVVGKEPTALPGVFRLRTPVHRDPRGSFSPAWVKDDLVGQGLDATIAQVNVATNPIKGTLRGLHFQSAPFTEVKIIQVLTGAIFDVAVDLRQDSPTFGRAVWWELDAESREALYLPKGVAHGYQTLAPETTVLYTVSAPYAPKQLRGLCWSDPSVAIPWPLPPAFISDRDRALPLFDQLVDYPEADPCR